MTDNRHDAALQRLNQLDGHQQPGAGATPGATYGAPGSEMFGSLFLPGFAALKRRPLYGLLLLILGVFAPIALVVWAFYHRDDLVGFALQPMFLWAVVGVSLALVLVRLLAILEIRRAYANHKGIGWKASLATLVVLALGLPVLWAGWQANSTRSLVADVFAGGTGESLYVPETNNVDPTAVRNILLIGSDAGPTRSGERTDSMIVLMVHEFSGRAALISVSRDLHDLQFPPGTPMADQFPNGFNSDVHNSMTNAIFAYLSGRDEMLEYYGQAGLHAKSVALSEGIGYSLGIEIDDYAFVDMQGFADIIDAIGGVTIEVETELPLPGDVAGMPATIGPGVVKMDGVTALGYARSRKADSDYFRMQRQRKLLAALGGQASPTTIARNYGQITGTLDDAMRTSLTSQEFSELLDVLGDDAGIGESVGLNPPLLVPEDPDYEQIKLIADAVQNYVLTGEPSGYSGEQ